MSVLRRSRHSGGKIEGAGGDPPPNASRPRLPRLLWRVIVGVLVLNLIAAAVVMHRRQSTTVNTSLRGQVRSATATAPVPPVVPTTVGPIAAVAAMGTLRAPNALVTAPSTFTAGQLKAIQSLKGVKAVETVDVGTVQLAGEPAVTVGVNPDTFRNFTPKVTASADRLWQYIAAGSLGSSFEMSRDRKLSLGVEVPVSAQGSRAQSNHWLGAFLSVGIPGVDMVVSQHLSAQLGLSPGAGLVVSAPSADPFSLQTAIQSVVHNASVVLMRPGLAIGTAGSRTGGKGVVTPAQLSTALTAALSRVGLPYVWGGTGPQTFDCSGLVGWSFAAAGVYLPRTAASQALAGASVPLSQIQPGDLLFWAFDPTDPTFIDHVAIYLGHGQMVQAPETGELVDVVPIYNHDLVGAVRVNPAIAARLGSPWRQGASPAPRR